MMDDDASGIVHAGWLMNSLGMNNWVEMLGNENKVKSFNAQLRSKSCWVDESQTMKQAE